MAGEVGKPIKNLVRSGAEYEFTTNSLSDEDGEEGKDDGKVEEEKKEQTVEPTISLKGIIWRELGKETYEKWSQYYAGISNANELTLAIKMYERLLEFAYK